MRTARAYLRFAAFFLLTFGIYGLWWLGSFFVSGEKAKIRWREFIFRNWSKGFVSIAGLKLEVKGAPPAQPFLLVSNHLSYMDIPALRSVAEGVYVAKGDIEGWFMAGTMIKNIGMIYVNRQNRRDIPRAGAEIVGALERGEGVMIFVEGTTSNGSTVLPFNSSFLEFATARDLPVHYASITYRTPPGEESASESVCWWREESEFAPHLFELFKIPKFYGTITFGAEPIRSNDRKELANKLREAVINQFTPVK